MNHYHGEVFYGEDDNTREVQIKVSYIIEETISIDVYNKISDDEIDYMAYITDALYIKSKDIVDWEVL